MESVTTRIGGRLGDARWSQAKQRWLLKQRAADAVAAKLTAIQSVQRGIWGGHEVDRVSGPGFNWAG
jgi:hypothetical protein